MSRQRPPEGGDRTPSRIELHSGGLFVVVESTDPLGTVKRTAVDLIKQLHTEQIGRKVGVQAEAVQTAGFASERPWMPADTDAARAGPAAPAEHLGDR